MASRAENDFRIEPWSATAWSVHYWSNGHWLHIETYRTRREAEECVRLMGGRA